MTISLTEVAELTGGKITGDENIKITNLAKIEDANPGELTFLYLSAYEKYFAVTKASAILVKPGFNKTRRDIAYIEVNDPNKAFSKILIHYFSPEFSLTGIDISASVHPLSVLGKNVALGKNVVVSAGCRINDNVKIFHNTVLLENVVVDEGTIIFQNVSIREKVRIGKRVIIHPGAVIGSDGGSKLDNLVQIAHNVVVGEDTVISAQTGISGSTKIGNHCILAGQVGVVGHIEIGDNIIVMARSGISKSLSKPGEYFGLFAQEAKISLKQEAHIRSLPDYLEKIKQLEKQVKLLTEEIKKLSNPQSGKPDK
ncbi:MAG: LpxD N-terminal domain-containing protein [Ignavibacteriaceae bacterium]